MDKVLKQRLVGATILIALAVIFVPMLFEEPETVDRMQDLSMDIPSPPPGRGEIRRLPLDPERVSQAQPSAPIDSPPVPVAPELSEPEPEARNQPTPSESQSTVGSEPQVEPVEAPESSLPESEPEEIARVDAPASQDSGADDQSLPAPSPAPVPPAEESVQGDWMVQVASFSSIETAERIKAQLAQLGHRADSDLLVRGDTRLHRVWTGPYLERSQAERASSQIAATVRDVEPLVKAISGSASVQSTASGPVFSVQVGVFAEQGNSERQRDQLVDQGFEAFIYYDESGSRPVWRVRVGRYAGREQAEVLLDRLNAEASLEGLIVTHP
ncbi:MAG: SPOR domain-containing protein [Wenzhouxiangella sp.]|jgi:DedD protein|nr:SPOR domain-containing protein [Wenzhouxiangella sp.]